MVHQYKMGGYNIVIDVNSGAIHVVDDMTYDMIEMYESSDKDSIFAEMAKRYPDHKDEIAEVWDEIAELIAAEELFTKDSYEPYITDFAKSLRLSRHCVYILPTIATWHASIALQRRASITANVNSCLTKSAERHWIFWLPILAIAAT